MLPQWGRQNQGKYSLEEKNVVQSVRKQYGNPDSHPCYRKICQAEIGPTPAGVCWLARLENSSLFGHMFSFRYRLEIPLVFINHLEQIWGHLNENSSNPRIRTILIYICTYICGLVPTCVSLSPCPRPGYISLFLSPWPSPSFHIPFYPHIPVPVPS